MKIPLSIHKLTGRPLLKLSKASPEILMGLGIVGVIGSTVLACRATLKAEAILDTHRTKLEKINSAKRLAGYSSEDATKDLVIVYTQSTVDMAKLYAPAVILGAASIACLLGSHQILKGRNVALAAAYKVLDEGFEAYRTRVREEHGEERDYMYKHGLRAEVVEESVKDPTTGKTKKVKTTKLKKPNPGDPNTLSVYARFFDEGSDYWTPHPEYNLMFLRAQQNYLNDLLRVRGHVFLNEAYDHLGIPRTHAGQEVGWALDADGDGYIDFGIFDGDKRKSREFVNGYEQSILLDFNVDGVIHSLLDEGRA